MRGLVAGLVIAVIFEAVNVLLGSNFRAVIPGAVYRCSQPQAGWLASVIEKYGIRTVINLRGCCDPVPWYLDQCRITSSHEVSQEDLSFSAGKLPPVPMIRELVRVLDSSEKPILIHCHKGIDRTGMASTLALLLYTDTPLEEARKQLGLRFGHLPFGRTGNIDRFYDLYAEWLAANDRTHSREAIRWWIENEYCAGECSASFTILEPSGDTVSLPHDRPCGIVVRCTNTSVKPWRLRPGNNAGIHAAWELLDSDDRAVARGRAGLFHAVVEPDDHIDLTLSVPAIAKSGRYMLRVDMEDEQHAKFFQEGSEPLFAQVEVP